jgi:hypothetical protein
MTLTNCSYSIVARCSHLQPSTLHIQVFSVDQRTMAMLDRYSSINSDDSTKTHAYILAAMADYCIFSRLTDKQYSSSGQTRNNRPKHWPLTDRAVLLHNEQCGLSELAKVYTALVSMPSYALL